jgi:hypothetical protein
MKSTISDNLVKNHKTELDTHITGMETVVNGNSPVLDNDERSKYGRGGGKSNSLLIADVSLLSKTQPQLNSPLIDWNEFNADLTASKGIEEMLTRLYGIIFKLESAKMMHDYDNYMDTIDQYAHLQYLARNGVQGASEAVNLLKVHFKRAKVESTVKK